MDISIREARSEDAETIAKINIASWRTTYRGLIEDATLDAMNSEEYLKKWNNIFNTLGANENFCFVAENTSGDVVGYSLCGKNRNAKFDFNGEIFAIYLLKEFQGQGIGKKLFLQSVHEFKKRDIASFLLFVLSSNSPSRKFYESFNPDFTTEETITIDKRQYYDFCYRWSDIEAIL